MRPCCRLDPDRVDTAAETSFRSDPSGGKAAQPASGPLGSRRLTSIDEPVSALHAVVERIALGDSALLAAVDRIVRSDGCCASSMSLFGAHGREDVPPES